MLSESKIRTVIRQQQKRQSPLIGVLKIPRTRGPFPAQAQAPFIAKYQIAGAVAGILDQAGHCGVGLPVRIDPGDRAPDDLAPAVATHMAYCTGSREGLKDLARPRLAVRILVDLN